MMSSSNNRSPIMMNIKDKSPIKKISKAVRRGAQFCEQVQTRMAEVDNNHHKERHSPTRHRHHHSNSSSGDMDSAAYRSRVRDQINRFNSVAVPSSRSSAANDDNGSNSTSSTKEHRHHHPQVTTSSRRQHRQQQKSSDNSKYAEQADRSNNETHYSEKENESNLPAAAAVDTKAASPYSFTSKDGVRVLSPAMHRHKQKSPKKGSSSSSTSPQKATTSSPKKATSSSSPRPIHSSSPAPTVAANNNETTCDETEMLKKQLRALEKDNEKLMKRNSRLERKCDKLARDNTQLQAAGKNGDKSSSTPYAACQQDESNSQENGNSCGMQQEEQSNKRDPDDHPLIGSPLRKHMKLVHESAESNCTVTMRKAPFPLLPPEQTRVIMEERMKEREGEEEDDGPHLGMLGSVTGTPSMEVDANFALSYKKRRGKRTKDGEGNSSGEEEAVDLLTSAAFMFKTSRRNLL